MNEDESEMLQVPIDKFEDLWCCPQQRLLLDHHLQYFTSSWPLTQEVLQGGDAASASLKLAQVSSIMGIISHVGMNQNPKRFTIVRGDEHLFTSYSGMN